MNLYWYLFYLFVPITTARIVLGDPPSYSDSGISLTRKAPEGETVTLECRMDNADKYQWRKDGTLIDAQSRLLLIDAVKRQDSGRYSCLASNAFGTIVSPSITLIAEYLDDFVEQSTEYQLSVSSGGSLVLRRPSIVASQQLDVQYSWFKDGNPISLNSTNYVTARGDLVLSEVSGQVYGTYKVTASSDSLHGSDILSRDYSVTNNGESWDASSSFSIIYSPDDRVLSLDTSSDVDVAYQFDCVTTFREGVTTKWFVDGHPLSAQQAVSMTMNSRRLAIGAAYLRTLSKGDHTLECKVSANSSRLSKKHRSVITIQGPPNLASLPSTVRRLPLSSLQLECRTSDANDDPSTTIGWYFNGLQVPSPPPSTSSPSSALLSIPVIDSDSFGVYQCLASNSLSDVSALVWLREAQTEDDVTVLEVSSSKGGIVSSARLLDEQQRPLPRPLARSLPSSSVDSPPSLSLSSSGAPFFSHLPPADDHIPVGTVSHLIPCQANGQPPPSILWKYQGHLLDLSSASSTKYESTDSGLLIHDVTSSDAGEYICVARNEKGTVSETTHLSVSGGGFIETRPSNQSMLIGTTLEIPCQVAAAYRNQARLDWFFNDEAIPSGGNPGLRLTRSRKGSLLIGQVGPDSIGEYRCEATVGESTETASMWLEIIEKPGMPAAVAATLVNDTLPAKIRITWNEGFDGNSPIIRYTIQMRTMGATDLWSDWESVGEADPAEHCCSYLLDNLKPSVTAEFRVIASNKHGPGKPSLSSASVTMPQQPPAAAPKNVAASARSSNSIIVQWQKPQDELFSGDIMGYVIRYRLAGYTLPWIEKNVTAREARNAVIEQLITWQEYELQVAAYNERGLGVFSRSIDVTTAEGVPTQAPKSVRAKVLNSTAVAVSFRAPDQQRIPGVNLGYKVQFWKGLPEKGSLHKQVLVDPTGHSLNVVVEGLEKYGHYNLTVLCYTTPGDGPRSQPQSVVTMQDVPGPVSALTIQEETFDGALITWEPPLSPNGIITRYVVRYWSDSSPDSKTSMELGPDERKATISGLQSTSHYSVDLVASTAVGDGPTEETKFESGRPPVLPERASGLSVSDVQARSVQLQFVPGHDGFTSIRQWIVEARVAESAVFHAIFNISAPKARSLTVTGLRPYTDYQLRLVPENVKGRGAPSEPTRTFQTKQTEPESPAASSLMAEPVSATSISLSWTPLLANQWNGQPKGYLILYREEQGKEEWSEVRIPLLRASEFTLSSLRPFSSYQVDLYAENMYGRSNSAGIALARTYESVPSSSPMNVRAEKAGRRSALIQWAELVEGESNGDIIGYTVRLVPEADWLHEDETKVVQVTDRHQLKTKVTGLRPFTTYHVFVSAQTIVGSGPENDVPAVLQTDEELPGAPSGVAFALVSPNEIRLKWRPPEQPNGNITGYMIRYWEFAENVTTAREVPIRSSSLGGFTATDLRPDTQYTFVISAKTSIGYGPETQVVVVTSAVREPMANPPRAVRDESTAHSSSQISIRWDGGDGGRERQEQFQLAPVRFVQVEYQKANDDKWTSLERSIEGNRGGVTVTRLSANSAYRFRLRFVGDFAQSSWSAESDWLRTLPAPPLAPPTSLTPTPEDSSSLLLRWNSPPRHTWNADSIGYRISFREYPSRANSSWQSEDVAAAAERPDKEEFTLHRLASFRHYIIRVSTFNTEGESPFSPPVFVYVGYSIPKRNISGLLAEPLSSSSIAVRWDAWKEDESDVISGFKVRFVPVTSVLSPTSRDEELMVVETNECLLVDLLKYTEYQITVTAFNRAGEGALSAVRLRTLEDVPGPVGNIRFSDVLLDSVRVSWDPPQQPNGIVTNYTINYRTFKMQAEFKREWQSKTEQCFFPASQLDEGGLYTFTVWAETAAGRGTEAVANVTVGPSPVGPPSPSRPAVVPGQSSVTLAWRDTGNDVIGHLIQAKRVSSVPIPIERQSPFSPFSTPPSSTSSSSSSPKKRRLYRRSTVDLGPAHIIGQWVTLKMIEGHSQKHEISYRDLEPSSVYVFRVYSRNARGVGKASEETDPLTVPAFIPEDPFYTSMWFIGLVAMTTFVIVVIVVAFLCVTGSEAKFKRSKRRNSSDSLQLADGNFAFHSKANQRQMNRSRNDLLTRPGTTQSWLSDREPPAYGSVLAVDREGTDGSSAAGGGAIVNMYGGLATDVLPTPPHQPNHQAMQRLSALVGRDVRGSGSAYVMGGGRGVSDEERETGYGAVRAAAGTDYASRSEYAYGMRGDYARSTVAHQQSQPHDDYRSSAADSFDDDEEEESVADGESVPGGRGTLVDGDNLADHYAHTDHYRDTWRRVRDTEAVRAPLPPSSAPSNSSRVAESPAASSDSNWHSQPAATPLANGFSSFV